MKFGKLICTAIVGALLISGCSASNNRVAVKVGDTDITEGAVKFMAQYGMGTTDADAAAEALEESYLLKELAEKMDVTMSDEESKEIKSSVANVKAQLGGREAADKILRDLGVDDEIIETILSSQLYSSKVTEGIDVAEPSDDEKKQFFKDNYLRAKHVLIMTTDQTTGAELDDEKKAEAEKKANEVLEKAKNGEDFDALVKEYNEDPGMEAQPDGYVFTDGVMMKEFEDATKSIEPGEITMCQTDYGYHIIKRLSLEESPEGFEKLYADNQSDVESSVASKKLEEALDKKAEELGIVVEENQEVIDAIVIESPTEQDDADAQ